MAADLLWEEIGHGCFNGEKMRKTGSLSGNILKDSSRHFKHFQK